MGSKLLPPIAGVQIAWAQTGKFSNDPHSVQYGLQAEATLKDIVKRAGEKPYRGKEQEYVGQASVLIDSSLRALDTIYKGRDLDFKENAKLRESSLDSAKSILKFGSDAKDYLKALPGTAMGSTLAVGIASILHVSSALSLSMLGVGVGVVGYLVNVWGLNQYRKGMERYYVRQDYERTLYFDRYVKPNRSRTTTAIPRPTAR